MQRSIPTQPPEAISALRTQLWLASEPESGRLAAMPRRRAACCVENLKRWCRSSTRRPELQTALNGPPEGEPDSLNDDVRHQHHQVRTVCTGLSGATTLA